MNSWNTRSLRASVGATWSCVSRSTRATPQYRIEHAERLARRVLEDEELTH